MVLTVSVVGWPIITAAGPGEGGLFETVRFQNASSRWMRCGKSEAARYNGAKGACSSFIYLSDGELVSSSLHQTLIFSVLYHHSSLSLSSWHPIDLRPHLKYTEE